MPRTYPEEEVVRMRGRIERPVGPSSVRRVGFVMSALERVPWQRHHLTLRSARRARLEGSATPRSLPITARGLPRAIETHRCAMLLRMRLCGSTASDISGLGRHFAFGPIGDTLFAF
jgi:hypothetical protein